MIVVWQLALQPPWQITKTKAFSSRTFLRSVRFDCSCGAWLLFFSTPAHVQLGSGQRLVKMFTVEPDTRQNKMQRILNGSKTTRIVRNDAIMSVCVTQTTLNSNPKQVRQGTVSQDSSVEQGPKKGGDVPDSKKGGDVTDSMKETEGNVLKESSISSPSFSKSLSVPVDQRTTNDDGDDGDEELVAAAARQRGVNPDDLNFETILATPKLNHLFRRFVIQKFSLSMFSCWKDLGKPSCLKTLLTQRKREEEMVMLAKRNPLPSTQKARPRCCC